jgi:hypothetical protein
MLHNKDIQKEDILLQKITNYVMEVNTNMFSSWIPRLTGDNQTWFLSGTYTCRGNEDHLFPGR